ncbi:SRPBCC family protein [Amycolatopsis anabasis]|uniref:SRPBCC family protein n=1 Tax=Amycolatopsis anabasis TaxID=1840409 RepID=UPI00131E512F|nr:SRPBCC domain-containing protein [Amycolatopsis anabasis]
MIEIVRETLVPAGAEEIWAVVAEPAEAAKWYALADRVVVVDGDGPGQRRRQYGYWGRRRSEVDQEIIRWEPPRRLVWQHLAERLDGKPAPRLARRTEFAIELEPRGAQTLVRLRSRQEPAGPLRGILIRLAGKRFVTAGMTRSLNRLRALFEA